MGLAVLSSIQLFARQFLRLFIWNELSPVHYVPLLLLDTASPVVFLKSSISSLTVTCVVELFYNGRRPSTTNRHKAAASLALPHLPVERQCFPTTLPSNRFFASQSALDACQPPSPSPAFLRYPSHQLGWVPAQYNGHPLASPRSPVLPALTINSPAKA